MKFYGKLLMILAFSLFIIGIPGISKAGVCINNTGYCNDIKLAIGSGEGEIIHVYGYEYGCGYNDRQRIGSVKVVGNVANIGMTGVANGYQLAGEDIALNLSTGTGTGNWHYHYSSYHGGTSSYALVSCPSLEGTPVVEDMDAANP